MILCSYPSPERSSEYREGIFVGYRYYDTAGVPVLYPFGHGLSYTSFTYGDLNINEGGISVCVKNTGDFDGAEIVQMYVAIPGGKVFRPQKELKGFKKVFLKSGETKRVDIPFDDKSFRFFNVRTGKWEIEEGDYEIRVGASSSDIRLTATCHIKGERDICPQVKKDEACVPGFLIENNPYTTEGLKSYFTGKVDNVSDSEYRELLGRDIPDGRWSGAMTVNDAICQMYYANSRLSRLVYRRLTAAKKRAEEKGKPDLNTLFIYNMPFRALAKMSGGAVDMEMVRGILEMVNGHFFRGIKKVILGHFRNRQKNREYEKLLKKQKELL